jgi:hypothetical protein
MIRHLILPAMGLSFAILSTGARADSSCDPYRGQLKDDSPATAAAVSGTSALDSSGGAFASSGSAHEAERARIQNSTSIPPECKAQLLKELGRNSFSFSIRGNAGAGRTQSTLGSSTNVWPEQFQQADSLYSQYNGLYGSFQGSCGGISPQQCYQSFAAQFKANPNGVASQYGSSFAPGDVQVLQAYQSVIMTGNEKDALAFISAKKDGLSKDQFLEMIQMVGARMSDDYQYARAQIGPAYQGIVTGDQILQAALNNTQQGYLGYYDGMETYAGVCRDIATLQAKMLQARGFPNSLVLTYAVAGIDFHVTSITQDPDDATKIYRFNYDHMVTITDADGPIALFQQNSGRVIGVPDTGINYYLSKPEGAVVADVPSEMGKFLAEAAGFDIHQMDPMARTTSSMLGASYLHDSENQKDTLGARAIFGQDGVGGQYAGGAADYTYGQGTWHPGKVGIFVGVENRPGAVYGTDGNDTMAIMYLQEEQHVITPALKLKHDITIRLDTSLTALALFAGMLPGGPDAKDLQLDGDVRLRSELRMEQSSFGGKLQSTYRAGVDVNPGFADIRNIYLYEDLRPTLNSAYVSTDQRLRIHGKMVLLAALTAAFDELGARGQATLGIATKKFAATAFVSGRLTNGTALYEDNTLRRVGASLTYAPNKHIKIMLTGQMPIEGSDPIGEAVITGNVQVDY